MRDDLDYNLLLRLWDLGIPLDAIGRALDITARQAGGLIHAEICVSRSAREAAESDVRLAVWWHDLQRDARDVARGRRAAVDVAREYATKAAVVRALIREPRTPRKRTGHRPPIRGPIKGRLYTAHEYGISATEAARQTGIAVGTVRRYYAKLRDMTPAQRAAEAVSVEADAWIIINGRIEKWQNERD